ncbi:MAG TPA: cobalamin-binding protein [Rheinheimera sp.]|uniref:cobalamin-binding protein n=1 Tax=Rheinheimera sp. TaxID=1869214 RepID=UPI002F930F8D
MKRWLMLILLLNSSLAWAEQRIIALAPHITEMLYAIGAGDRLVAVSDYSDYPEQAADLPSVANYASINIEAVLALQPDLVIAWRTGNPQADVKRLQQLGIEVAFSDPLTLDDIAEELIMLGELTGLQPLAQQQAEQFKAQLNQQRQQYQHKTPVTVFFAMGTTPLSTVANNAWPQQILALCRAENPFAKVKGDYPQVGIEQVLLTQPEVIIQPAGQGRSADFRFWKTFQSLPAVKAGHFLTVNADYLFRTTPRTLLGIQQLCQGVDHYR